MLRTELEVLTGKLIRGDITPIVYELIKDSPYLEDIFEYSSVSKEDTGNDSKESISGHTYDNSCPRPSFEGWFRDQVQSVTIQGVRGGNTGVRKRKNRDERR